MSDDFEGSDLTDLEDETYNESTATPSQKKKTVKASGDAYQVRGALKAPRTTTISARSLHEQLYEGDINLDAEYQRDVVWPVSKQIGLIDSLFRNFYIPPVIFSVTELSDGSQRKVCIDGKQRLTSIWRFPVMFFANSSCSALIRRVTDKDPFTHEKFFFKELPDRKEKGKILPERYRKIFENKQIVCMEYSDLTDSNEREVFQRVQLGMALTPAEKLQAIHSDASIFVHNLQQEYVNDRLAEHLEWDTARASDFRCLSTAMYMLDKTTTVTFPGITTIHKWLEGSEGFSDTFTESIHQTFKIFVWLAEDKDGSKCFNMEKDKKKLKVSPLEFVATVLMIHQHKSKLTLKQLSEAIRKMRSDVRAAEQDIRLNNRCMRIVTNFIKNLKPSTLKADPDHSSATNAIKKLFKPKTKLDEDFDREIETKSPKKNPVKRKRDDSDEEYRPQKPPQRSSGTQKPSAKTPVKQPSTNGAPSDTPLEPSRTPPSVQPSSSTSASSLPPKPVLSHPLPPPPPLLPPPPIPTEPRMHPDRLAALRLAKNGIPVPTYVPPQLSGHPRPNSPTYISPASSYTSRWPNHPSSSRIGPIVPMSDVGPPPHSSDRYREDERLSSNGAYQPAVPVHPNQRPVSHGRDDYYDRGGYSSRYSGPRYSR